MSTMDKRLLYLDSLIDNTKYAKQKAGLGKEFSKFLQIYANERDIVTAQPCDVRRFLVFKDSKGKTVVHNTRCQHVGVIDAKDCDCPRRLSAGTTQSVIGKLKSIFNNCGRVGLWNGRSGNPANCPSISKYLVAVKREQAESHIVPKQAKPLFLGKLKNISAFIYGELSKTDKKPAERYIMLRDQAFFKLQFFGGDRAADLCRVLVQEVKRLPDDTGLLFSHSVGKTLSNGMTNTFAIKRVNDKIICPVKGLDDYVYQSTLMDICLDTGFLFRLLDSSRNGVLDEHLTYSAIYDRLRFYLNSLGINEGETPHSLRRGCAVTLSLTGEADKAEKIMGHIGWFSEGSLRRYNNIDRMLDSSAVSSLFANVADSQDEASKIYDKLGCADNLSPAWM